MHQTNFSQIMILSGLFLFSCGGNSPAVTATPDMAIKETSNQPIPLGESNVNRNMDGIIEDLNMEIKKLKAELEYQNENINKMDAQSKIWANPFAIYNKEIVLSNGSSIFGKIVYQDQDVMKVETLIGQLIIDRSTVVRVVNQVSVYNQFDTDPTVGDTNDGGSATAEASGVNLIQKRVKSLSANLVLAGDISEEKDGSGNTVLSGEIKNVGNKRADFAKIIFTFRMNWQGDTKTLTAFINGVTNTFDTGISSDNSILPHAVGGFELIIPKSFGAFIGYSYEIDWSQYDG